MLREVFLLDDGSGVLPRERFHWVMCDEESRRQLVQIGMPVDEADDLFDILDAHGKGVLGVDDFTDGWLRLTANASSKDLLSVQIGAQSLAKHMSALEQDIDKEGSAPRR